MPRKTVDTNALQPSKGLKFLYETAVGRCVLKVATQVWVSRLVGAYMNCPLSRGMIKGAIRKNNIDMDRFVPEKFRCFNDFFTRELKPELKNLSQGLMSPCDSKLTVYPITPELTFQVKGSCYRVEDLLQDRQLAREFMGGQCLVFRLSVDDYHRYGYFDDCQEEAWYYIKGRLHTVQPIAFRRYDVFKENCREVTLLHTRHYGKAVQIEVGATCVGKIANRHTPGDHARGEEKGRFLFGGSTIVLLLKNAEIDPEILENSAKGLETVVHFGEQIGK